MTKYEFILKYYLDGYKRKKLYKLFYNNVHFVKFSNKKTVEIYGEIDIFNPEFYTYDLFIELRDKGYIEFRKYFNHFNEVIYELKILDQTIDLCLLFKNEINYIKYLKKPFNKIICKKYTKQETDIYETYFKDIMSLKDFEISILKIIFKQLITYSYIDRLLVDNSFLRCNGNENIDRKEDIKKIYPKMFEILNDLNNPLIIKILNKYNFNVDLINRNKIYQEKDK